MSFRNAQTGGNIQPSSYFKACRYSLTLTVLGDSVWNTSIVSLNKLMYTCFKDHTIKELKLTSTREGRAIQWKANKWDQEYDLIHHYSVKVIFFFFHGGLSNILDTGFTGLGLAGAEKGAYEAHQAYQISIFIH